MTIVYFDCSTGISANMVFAALVDAGADPEALRSWVATLPLGPVDLDIIEVDRGGLRARQVTVRPRGDEPRRNLADVEAVLGDAELSHAARDLAVRVYQHLAEAEARVHGSTPAEVTFHEVGSAAAIVAVAGTAVALDLLGIDRVVASPVATGTGTVRTEHGVLPVPTPATLELLKGVPVETREVTAELVTPTGAAILAAAANAYGPMPPMTPDAVGYGAGPHLLPFPNVLRAVVGRSLGSDEGYESTAALDVSIMSITRESRPRLSLSTAPSSGSSSTAAQVAPLGRSTVSGWPRMRSLQVVVLARRDDFSTPVGPVRIPAGVRRWPTGKQAVTGIESYLAEMAARASGSRRLSGGSDPARD